MISAAKNGQGALSDVATRNITLSAAQEVPVGNSSPQASATASPDVSSSLRQDEPIPNWKRLLDLTFIFLTMPFWLSTMILASIWILIVSPGPLLYRQERIGYRARRFLILKFRTMRLNAETLSHEGYFEKLMQSNCPMTKLDSRGDARLICGGRILRALGLDELPQLFNVIRGEMSLVGPRPCTCHEFDRYLPEQKLRVNAPPGLTGYWQVNGKNKTSFGRMIEMDKFYAANMSLKMDLTIIARTLPAIAVQVIESRTVKSRRSKITAVIKKNFAQFRSKTSHETRTK